MVSLEPSFQIDTHPQMPKTKQFDEAAVLRKATAVFNEKGYNGTSIDDLVRATGLSRSSIYDTFGDKHGLFLRSLEQYQQTQAEGQEITLEKTASPKKKIQLLFNTAIQEVLTDKKKAGCFLINVSAELGCIDKEIASKACETMEVMEDRFHHWVKEGQAKGEISKKFSARALARHLYNSLTGLKANGKTRADADALKDIVKVTLAALEE